VVEHESGGDPYALSATSDGGCWQIHYPAHYDKLYRITGSYDIAGLYDVRVNTEIAHILWLDQGWAPWAVCRGTAVC
jgi:hypothetical protein